MAEKGFHPACEASPSMSDEEYAGLLESIEKCGQIMPITRHQGQILDGRHRYKACIELGIEPHYLNDDELIETGGDPWEFVWATMQHKRPSTGELAVYSAKWQKAIQPAAQLKKGHGKTAPGKKNASNANAPGNVSISDPGPTTRDTAGEKFGVSGRTVQKASNVLDNGVPKLQDAMGKGQVNVTLAEKVSKLDKKHQEKLVSEALKSENPEKVLKEAVKPKPPESVEQAEEVEPAKPKAFDSYERVEKITDWLREELDEWPEGVVPKALSAIDYLLTEYRK